MDDRGPAFARGFRIDFYDLRRDGLRTYTWSVREPAALERVQYLRGPASVLYGDGSPGGLVNLMLKKPLPVPRTELTASIGELRFGRFTADVTGPVGGNRRVRYRLIGAGEWLDSGIDNDERRLSLLPMLSVDVGDAVTLHMDGELYQQRGRNYWHMVPVTAETQRGDFTQIPWDLTTASPDDDWSGWNASSGLRLDARLNRRSSLHVSTRYTRIDGDIDIQVLAGVAQDGRTANRYAYRELSSWNEYQSDAFIATAVATGPVEHQLVIGAEAGLSTAERELGTGAAPSLDLHSPVYGPKPLSPPTQPTKYDVVRAGTYVQDQIRLSSAIVITPALRWSWLNVEHRALPNSGLDEPSRERESTDTAVSPGKTGSRTNQKTRQVN
jgi:iron complex outermembrane receptor protein